MGKRHEQTPHERRYTDGKQTHEKMLKITYHQGMAKKNNKTPPYINCSWEYPKH